MPPVPSNDRAHAAHAAHAAGPARHAGTAVQGASRAPHAGGRAAGLSAAGLRDAGMAWLERVAVARLARSLAGEPVEIVLPDGERLPCGPGAPEGRLRFRERRALWALLAPERDLRLGDLYAEGAIEVEGDLVRLLRGLYRVEAPPRRGQRLRSGWRRLRRHGTGLRSARDNVHAHYDLGNDFYALWLDREMVYTCAYFPTPEATLEEAQRAKMDLVCRKLRLRADERVVEAGCGWGALALHMARQYGVRVRAFNVSPEQLEWARARCRVEGLEGRVEFVEDDYRNARGGCDVFVSVGMLEHVGPEHYRTFGRVIDRLLGPNGRGLLHFIGRDRPMEFNPWVERRIFPGAYAPSLREAGRVLEPSGFSVVDVENLRPHYARTLEHWLRRFEDHADEVRRRFDERFVRTWRLYLAGSAVSFHTGWLQLFQVLFARAGADALPETRTDLLGAT